MKKIFSQFILSTLTLSLLLFVQCSELERITGFSEVGVENIQHRTAVFTLNLGDVSEPSNTEIGFCWSLNPEPSVYDSTYSFGQNPSTGRKYRFEVGHLLAGTSYYLRAFARNGRELVYSREVLFSTPEAQLPQISTKAVTAVTAFGFTSGGEITSDGGSTITQAGLCWNTTGNPTVADSVVTGSISTNSFSLSINNLNPYTSYFVRAFAKNEAGIGYGNIETFTTIKSKPVVRTISVSMVTAHGAFLKGEIISNGGDALSDSGFVFDYNSNPTIGDYNVFDANFPGKLSAYTSSLNPNESIYIRAFAKNAVGVGYGESILITTKPATPSITDIDGNEYPTAIFGTKTWTTRNHKSVRYADGTNIPEVYTYEDNEQNVILYGRLYTWPSAMHNDTTEMSQGVCPNGWHVTSGAEWNNLVDFYGGPEMAGYFMKDIQNGLWYGLNSGENVQSAFIVPASGKRTDPGFYLYTQLHYASYFWTSLLPKPGVAKYFKLTSSTNNLVETENDVLQHGMSVRCVKN